MQIREKDMPREAELEVLELARTTAMLHQNIVCVNDSAALAGEFHADMLHLGQADGQSAPARQQLHRWAILGRSTHSGAEVDAAVARPGRGLPDRRAGVRHLAQPGVPAGRAGPGPARRQASLRSPRSPSKPFFAIGGIGLDTIDEVVEAGARRVAVVSAVTKASDPQEAAQQLRRRLQDAWDAEPAMERYVMQALAGAGSTR